MPLVSVSTSLLYDFLEPCPTQLVLRKGERSNQVDLAELQETTVRNNSNQMQIVTYYSRGTCA